MYLVLGLPVWWAQGSVYCERCYERNKKLLGCIRRIDFVIILSDPDQNIASRMYVFLEIGNLLDAGDLTIYVDQPSHDCRSHSTKL